MSVTISETAAQFVANVLETVLENEENAAVNLGKVTCRVPEETISLLDYVGSKLRMSRSALAAELLSRSVQEAVLVVGLPTEEDGYQLTLVPSEMDLLDEKVMVEQAIAQAKKDPDQLTDSQIALINKQASRQKKVIKAG